MNIVNKILNLLEELEEPQVKTRLIYKYDYEGDATISSKEETEDPLSVKKLKLEILQLLLQTVEKDDTIEPCDEDIVKRAIRALEKP